MAVVEFYELDADAKEQLVGAVTWDGQKVQTNSLVLAELIRQPILVVTKDGTDVVKPQDGERFLNGLSSQYRSPYFYATAPQEQESPDAGNDETPEARMAQNQKTAEQKTSFGDG